MAASGFTPIQLYYSTVSGHAPVAGGLVDGELAINTAEGKLYYKNSSGVVTLLAGISGNSGLSGLSGYSGFSGYSGSGISGYSGSGTSGYSGFSGISGYSGANGANGSSGISGYSGVGTSGFSGFSGATGASGVSGFSGGTGASGANGASGFSGFSGATGASGFSGFSGTGGSGSAGASGYSGFSGANGASGFSGFSGATGPTAYPSTGIAVSTGSAWGTSLADPLQVNHGGTGLSAVTANYIPFGSSSTALSTSSLFNWSTSTTRLGVGIASPVATLHVRGGNSNNAIVDNDGSQYTTMSWYNNGTEKAQAYFDATNILFVFGTDTTAPLIFKTNGAEGMRLSSGGGVSIGTSTGAGANNLLVNGTITAATQFSGPGTGLTGTASSLTVGGISVTDYSSTGNYSIVWKSGTLLYSTPGISITPNLGYINATQFNGSGAGLSGTASSLTAGNANALGGNGPSYYQTALGFTPVQQGGGIGQGTNKVYVGWSGSGLLCTVDVTNLGNFLLSSNYNSYAPTLTGGGASGTWAINVTGTAGTANALNSGSDYQVNRILVGNGSVGSPSMAFASDGATDTGFYWGGDGYINFANNGVYSGQINPGHDLTMVGNVTAYSDERLKTNIQTINNALDKVMNLRGVTFDKDGKEGLGVIAQEVQKVLPQVVLENNDEMKTLSVAYGNIVGVLIEAVKELKAEVEELKRGK